MANSSDTYAALTRQQWADYVSTYVPIENKLIDFAMDTSQPEKAMNAATMGIWTRYCIQLSGTARNVTEMRVYVNKES